MGIAVCGEFDKDDKFTYEYYFPYFIGSNISSDDNIQLSGGNTGYLSLSTVIDAINNRIVDNEPKIEAIIIRTIFGFLFNITDTPIKSNKSIKKLNIINETSYFILIKKQSY